MRTYRTLQVVQDPGHDRVCQTFPFPSPVNSSRCLCLARSRIATPLAQELASLFKETQSLPQVQQLTEEEIEAEIAAHHNGL